jgi:hypothetical protein
MALLIEKIHNVIADFQGKSVATKHPPERVDRVINLHVVEVYNKYLDHYVKTGKISDYLLAFKREKEINLTGGKGDLPADYAHYRHVYTMSGKKVDVVEDKFWNDRANRNLGGPSALRPICRLENIEEGNARKIIVLPSSSTKVKLEYFKYPTDAKYGYTKEATRYVFDEDTSIDLELPLGLYPDIINRILNSLGIVLREGQLIQVTEVLKSQEQIK